MGDTSRGTLDRVAKAREAIRAVTLVEQSMANQALQKRPQASADIWPIERVYRHLVCEFAHYDACLKGLVEIDGEYWFCELADYTRRKKTYWIRPIEWTDECTEYLADYRIAYRHWFHVDGKCCSYDGWPLQWFAEKWNRRNPIEQQVVRT